MRISVAIRVAWILAAGASFASAQSVGSLAFAPGWEEGRTWTLLMEDYGQGPMPGVLSDIDMLFTVLPVRFDDSSAARDARLAMLDSP